MSINLLRKNVCFFCNVGYFLNENALETRIKGYSAQSAAQFIDLQ